MKVVSFEVFDFKNVWLMFWEVRIWEIGIRRLDFKKYTWSLEMANLISLILSVTDIYLQIIITSLEIVILQNISQEKIIF